MKFTKTHRNNLILLVIILILVIPQTRQQIQILLHKGLAMFSPSVLDEDERLTLTDYNWKLVDENGIPLDFNNAKGKVVIINFWATWCPPCIAEMPSLESLYQKYHEEVIFLLVSSEEPEIVLKFKEKYQYDFLVYASVTAPPALFETSSIPRTFILNRNGMIVVDKSGAADWNSSKIHNVLDNLLLSK